VSTGQKSQEGQPAEGPAETAARATRYLMRRALKASLATIERGSGHPYASLVTVATEPDGAPILLLSSLAVHTRNFRADGRVSLLLDGTSGLADPLTGGRATLIGRIGEAKSSTARPRFLRRHPYASQFADFGDFAFYVIDVERAHYIGGFGRIVDVPGAALLIPPPASSAVAAGEAALIEALEAGNAALPARLALRHGGSEGPWRIAGIDAGGVDLVAAETTLRLSFPAIASDAGKAGQEVLALLG